MAYSPHRKFHASLSLERRPRLLKDFLKDDYQSYPRKPCKLHAPPPQLLIRSRSKAASTTISGAINKVINIVKFFPFAVAAVKSPSILPRTISRKLSRKTSSKRGQDNRVDHGPTNSMVKVKDILRWRSSRDLVEEKSSTPLDGSCYSTATTTTTTATASKRSSWCDSDFTAEDLPSWCGEIDEQPIVGNNNKKNIFVDDETVGGYFMDATMDKKMDPQVELGFDENDQHSPVSILESPFREDEDFSFNRSLATIESRKCMLMQRIQQMETLAGVEENTIGADQEKEEEEEIRGANDKAKHMIIHSTNNVITSCSDESYEWEVEEKREAYIKDMEKAAGMRWYNFDEEKEQLCKELEVEVFRDLVNEVLVEIMLMHSA